MRNQKTSSSSKINVALVGEANGQDIWIRMTKLSKKPILKRNQTTSSSPKMNVDVVGEDN